MSSSQTAYRRLCALLFAPQSLHLQFTKAEALDGSLEGCPRMTPASTRMMHYRTLSARLQSTETHSCTEAQAANEFGCFASFATCLAEASNLVMG